MTWFRCGGIPVTLKNAMNAVLNKKFGTSGQNYPPNGWPDDVNLLGPLPIKTASGAIASFTDGADAVPVKSCVVSFTPSGGGGTPSAPVAIQSVSGLSVTRCGINLFDEEWESGWIDNNGAEAVNASRVRSKNYNVIKGDVSYYIVASYSWRVYFYDASKTFISYVGTYTANRSITSPANAVYFRFAVIDTAPTSIGLNYPSTETSYIASHVSVVTDTFGQTLYGGTRDLTTDKASVTYKHYDLSQISWSGGIIGGQMWCWYADKSDDGLKLPANSAIFDGLCDRYTPIRYNGIATDENTIALRSNGYLYVNNGSDTVEPTGEVIIAYATAQEITGLTPHEIDTLYGDNNIYADTGTMSVEYRADIDLALNALQGSRSLSASLMRSESPEEVSEPEEIIQNTEEQEGENDER